MTKIESDIDPPFIITPRSSKTWHTPFDSGSFVGYIADFKTEIVSIKNEEGITKKYAGLRLFINLDKMDRGGYTIFVPYDPYFYFIPKKGKEKDVILFLKKNRIIQGTDGIKDVKIYYRHIFGHGDDRFIKYSPVYKVILYSPSDVPKYSKLLLSHPYVEDCREYKIPFTMRCSLDLQLFCFRYYKFIVEKGVLRQYYPIKKDSFPSLRVFTFDIEVRKKPIKKPQRSDPINVIGIKIGDEGYIINNVELTHFELPNFYIGVDNKKRIRRFTKKEAEKEGWKYTPIFFKTINVKNEKELIKTFYSLIEKNKPQAITGYASDFFDWPHLYHRGKIYGINFENLFYHDKFEGSGERGTKNFFGDFKRDGVQMFDVMDWTTRDSYVSKGMQGLKSISRELLGIEAIEIDHEEQVKVWERMENHLLNPDHPDNKDPKKRKKNRIIAFKQSLNHAIYCASDVFVTDIFARQSSLGLNIAVTSRIPMTLFEVSRKNRGPMVEADLLNRMRDIMIAPNKVMKKSREYINPIKIIEKSRYVYKEVKKRVNGADKKYWAKCLTLNDMKKHCQSCNNTHCKDNWIRIWKSPIDKQIPILCEKESIIDDPDYQVYYYPLENHDFYVVEEKYEGARVECFRPGIFKDNAEITFIINKENIKKFENLLHDALDRFASQMEKKNYTIINIESLHNEISKSFLEITNNLKENENRSFIWRGLPTIIHVDVASMYINILINFNLQPYSIVSKETCKSCKYYPKDDEKPCWLDMKWNAVYKVMNINREEQKKIEHYIQSQIEEGKELSDNEIVEIYKRYSSGAKKFNTYKFPVTTRFCQKSFKFFVNTIKDFRDKRYEYKYAMIERDEEIGKLKSHYKKHPSIAILEKIYKIRNDSIKSKLSEIINNIEIGNNAPELIKVTIDEIKSTYEEYGKLHSYIVKMIETAISQYGDRPIPKHVQNEINELSIQKVFARNMQLGMKVLLNSFYGYLKSIGARFWSIESAGSTCLKGQEIIDFAVDICSNLACGINIELDSLEYHERIIFRNPNGLIENLPIGEFVDRCFSKYGVKIKDKLRRVEYSYIPEKWKVLSVRKDGKIEWKRVKWAIRQETIRPVYNVLTPIGNVKTTSSHSIFCIKRDHIEPIEVKDLTTEYIAHVKYIPTVDLHININLLRENPDIDIFVFIPRKDPLSKPYKRYPISRIRIDNERKYFHRVPINEFKGTPYDNILIGGLRGYKSDPIIPITEHFAELLGSFVSRGIAIIRESGDIDVGIFQKKLENAKKIVSCIEEVGKHIINFSPPSLSFDKRRKIYQIWISNIFFYHLFTSIGCGKTEGTKRIPSAILSSPKNIQKAFLNGFFNDEKAYHKKALIFTTYNDGLCDDLFILGKQLGYIVTVNTHYSKKRKYRRPSYTIYFMKPKTWKKIGRSTGTIRNCGDVFGIRKESVTKMKKFGNYVYDLSVEDNDNFVSSRGGIVCHNTDGLWTALPSPIPLELHYQYKEKDDDEIKQGTFNIFNENLNYLVKEHFTNHNNYLPVNEKGDVDLTVEYNKEWNKNRKWKQKSICEIKFDYEGPFSTIFVYTKKRMKVYKRDKKNPKIQIVDTITGLDELRKGELKLIQKCSKEITEAYKDGISIEDAYKRACNVVNTYIDHITNHTLDLDLILESRDLSNKTAEKVKQAYKEYKKFLDTYNIDPDTFPVYSSALEKNVKNNPQWNEIWYGKKEGRRIKQGILQKISRSPYVFAAFRTMDLGISIEPGDTIEWIVTPYPQIKSQRGTYKKEKKSQRAIPSRVFNGTPEEIKKHLKRWLGESFNEIDMRYYVDWDFYLEKFMSMVERYLIIPAQSQGIDVYKWLHIKNKTKKTKKNMTLTEFFHPLSSLKK